MRSRRRPTKPGHARSSGRARLVLASAFSLAVLFAYLGPPPGAEAPAKVNRILERLEKADARGDSPVGRAAASRTRRSRLRARPSDRLDISFKRGRVSKIGRLKIQAIDLAVDFYEGVNDDVVKKGPGHWPGTPLPGRTGNSVFAGHRTTYTHPFEDLDLLKKGDRIITRINGDRTVYGVYQTSVVPEAEYVRHVLKQPRRDSARLITLFACTPKGFRTHRIVVKARVIARA